MIRLGVCNEPGPFVKWMLRECQEGVKSCEEVAKQALSTFQEGVKRVANGCEERLKICQEGVKMVSRGFQGLRVGQSLGFLSRGSMC